MEWITTKDQLPKEGQKVLVYRGKLTTIGYFESETESDSPRFYLPELEYVDDKIKFWMPMPEPPFNQQ